MADDARMTHPIRLHALAALWSLRAAGGHLAQAAYDEAHDIAAEVNDGLRSPQYGSRGSGGHSDPTASALLAGVRPNRAAQMLARTTQTVSWLANRLEAPGSGNTYDRLLAVLPTLRLAAAVDLHHWLTEEDDKIRLRLDLAPDRQPQVGVACPSCAVRQMYVLTSAPSRIYWAVICDAGCTCQGEGCTCGMPVKFMGVQHIWAAT